MADVLNKITEEDLQRHLQISDKPEKVKCAYFGRDILCNATRLKRLLAHISGKDVAICNSSPLKVMEAFKVRLKQITVAREKQRVADEILHCKTSKLLGDDEEIAMEAASLARTGNSTFDSVDLFGQPSSASAMGSTGSESMRGTSSLAPPRTWPGCQPTLASFDEVKMSRARMAVAR